MKIKEKSFLHFCLNFPYYFNLPEKYLKQKLPFWEKVKIASKAFPEAVRLRFSKKYKSDFALKLEIALINKLFED